VKWSIWVGLKVPSGWYNQAMSEDRKERGCDLGGADIAEIDPLGLRAYDLKLRGQVLFVLSFPTQPAVWPASLTPAERAVAAGILEGLGNEEIAQTREVSTRTVANQVRRIFEKMKVASRSELVAALMGPGRGRGEP